MALNIPNVGSPFDALAKGVDTGSNFFYKLIQPVLERERQKQLEQHFQQELALKKQAASRGGANSDLQRAILQERLKSLQNPNAELQQLLGLLGNKSGTETKSESYLPSIGGNFQGHEEEQYPDLEKAFKQGQFGQQEQIPELNEQAISPFEAQGQQQNTGFGGMDMEALKKAFIGDAIKKKFGANPFAPVPESPQDKRYADLQSKIELENIKTQNKTKGLEEKEIIATKKDLPTLEKSLKGVDELLRIAQNNPKMFGNGFMPDRYAKTTKIKDFGKWQNLISDAIAGLEQKLSAKGNIVALKMATQLKPSHAEQQQVAIGKLESMKQQLIDSINHSRELIGEQKLENPENSRAPQYKDDDLLIVEGPNGDETMTYAQARALGAK